AYGNVYVNKAQFIPLAIRVGAARSTANSWGCCGEMALTHWLHLRITCSISKILKKHSITVDVLYNGQHMHHFAGSCN
ncbi:MAG: hypothetical protein ABR574_11510, partial [Cryomorphaceae bacterium]